MNRRRIKETGLFGLDGLTNTLDLVGGQIVHDDDVARIERRGQAVFHVGFESEATHGAVDDERGADPVMTQAGDEGRLRPVAMRSRSHQPFVEKRGQDLNCGSPIPIRVHPFLSMACFGRARAARA